RFVFIDSHAFKDCACHIIHVHLTNPFATSILQWSVQLGMLFSRLSSDNAWMNSGSASKDNKNTPEQLNSRLRRVRCYSKFACLPYMVPDFNPFLSINRRITAS